MHTTPVIISRPNQPYVAIRTRVAMADIARTLPPLIPQLLRWTSQHHVTTSGPVFFHYEAIDQQQHLDVAVGIPVTTSYPGDNTVQSGAFPAGRYAIVSYFGDYKGLYEAHRYLEHWLAQHNYAEQITHDHQRTCWGGRTEFYLTDPDEEHNPERWQTDVAFLLASDKP